jgi:hypothetical protein
VSGKKIVKWNNGGDPKLQLPGRGLNSHPQRAVRCNPTIRRIRYPAGMHFAVHQQVAPVVAATPLDLPLGDPRSGTKIWRWLYEEIRDAIFTGRLKRGSRLPATRELSK